MTVSRKDEMRLNERRQNIQTRRQRRLDEKRKIDDTRWEKTRSVARRQRKGNSMRWEETRREDVTERDERHHKIRKLRQEQTWWDKP